MTGSSKIRLIHTSDTHLGADRRPAGAAAAFRAVVDAAAGLPADALLIVGDVFDHARVPDDTLEFFLQQVSRLSCPVVVLPGNHDLYHAESLYRREPFNNPPANFCLFTEPAGQTISLPALNLDLWGRAMTEHTPQFQPLAGMTPARPGRWLAALAHGHFHFPEDTELRSAPIYPAEVAAAPCHYLALGHWERFIDVSQGDTRAVYSGSPQGSAADDKSVAVAVVDFCPDYGVSVRQESFPIRA